MCKLTHWWCLDSWPYPQMGFLYLSRDLPAMGWGQSDLSGLSWCAVMLPMRPSSYSWGFVSETKGHADVYGLVWGLKPCWCLRAMIMLACPFSTVGELLAVESKGLVETWAEKHSNQLDPDPEPWIARPSIHSIYELQENCRGQSCRTKAVACVQDSGQQLEI